VGSHHDCRSHHATVRWVEPHPLIQVFGVEFEHVSGPSNGEVD
jgi:hypothetical protein